jgi:hypothetical protein
MRGRFEFSFHSLAPGDLGVDPTLALMGSLGWEIRGLAPGGDGSLVVALQRSLDDETALPDEAALVATLGEPLVAPSAEDLAV